MNDIKIELYNDHFENAKRYQIPKAQLIIADIPYNIGINAYGSRSDWYIGGDNKNGESEKAGKTFFDTDDDFRKAEAVNSNTQLYGQAGNSIVKQVLMAIFKEMI